MAALDDAHPYRQARIMQEIPGVGQGFTLRSQLWW